LRLGFTTSHSPEPPSHPNGSHAVEVEIDPETGEVSVDRYVMVDDLGQLLPAKTKTNPGHGRVLALQVAEIVGYARFAMSSFFEFAWMLVIPGALVILLAALLLTCST
jgi:Molybdopterin-binding domain of aldehyde dehydrogenase